MLTRRQFLQRSSLVAFAPMVPMFLPRMASAAGADKDARVLVVIQLDGGNDGLNTVIPFADDTYSRVRPTLRLTGDQILKLNDRVALHPVMRPMNDLVQDGRLAVVQNVGYPDPDRSHFGSMAVWHSARFTPEEQRGNGWIGTALDHATTRATAGGADAVFVGTDELPRALQARRATAAQLTRADDLEIRLPDLARPGTSATTTMAAPAAGENVSAFVRKRVLESVGAARDIADAARDRGGDAAGYPGSTLGQRLSLVSRMIKAGGQARVYYAAQTGYDTHGTQLVMHQELLGDLARSLKAFLDDLKTAKLDDRVVVLAFSEFGRRVAENGSAGTDHGTAGPVFLAGPSVRTGVHGEAPNLTDLDEGDLKMSLDFRQVYATLLKDWLRLPSAEALAGNFESLPLLRPSS